MRSRPIFTHLATFICFELSRFIGSLSRCLPYSFYRTRYMVLSSLSGICVCMFVLILYYPFSGTVLAGPAAHPAALAGPITAPALIAGPSGSIAAGPAGVGSILRADGHW